VRTRHLQLVTSTHSVTTTVRSTAPLHYGPVSPGSTTLLAQETLRANQLAQLSELLNSLESVVERLNFRSFTVYDTLNTAIEAVSVALSDTQTSETGTDANRS
jgi:hypothetical protein